MSIIREPGGNSREVLVEVWPAPRPSYPAAPVKEIDSSFRYTVWDKDLNIWWLWFILLHIRHYLVSRFQMVTLSLLLLLSLFLYFLWKCSGRWSCSPYPGQIWKKKKSERFSTPQMVCFAIIYQRPSTRFNKSQVKKSSKKRQAFAI